MNPGPPAPQAGVIIRRDRQNTVTQAFESRKLAKPLSVLDDEPIILGFRVILDKEPAYAEYNQRILKTLADMAANGRKRHTIKSTANDLRSLNRKTDLMNPEAVKLIIANWRNLNGSPASEARKHKMVWDYDYFVESNNLTWNRPKYNNDSPPPITPSEEQAGIIMKFAPSINALTIFQILLESGFEGEELHCCTEKNIDLEQGIITVEGHKEHSSRSYRFSKQTAGLLSLYMSKPRHKRLHPFPKPNIMYDSWRDAKTRAAKELNRADLLKIPLKGLRNLSGIKMWQKYKDPWIVMLHMGHKQLSTTQHYLSRMTVQLAKQEEYTVHAIKMGEQNTIEKICQLIEQGYKKETEVDGYQIFKKPK